MLLSVQKGRLTRYMYIYFFVFVFFLRIIYNDESETNHSLHTTQYHIFPHSYISLLFQTDVINSHHYSKALGLYLTKYQFYPFQLDLKNPQCYSVFITANEDQQRYTVCIIPTLLEKRIPKRFFTEG